MSINGDARGRWRGLAGHTRTTGTAGVEGAGENREPGCGARVRWRGLAGHTRTTGPAGVEGAGGTGGHGRASNRAWLQRPWAVAGPGYRAREWRRVLAGPHASTPGAASVEGAGGSGGPGCGARGRWRGLAGLRDDAPSEARGADGSRAGRRPRAQPAARPHSRIRRRPEHQRGHKHKHRHDKAGRNHSVPARPQCSVAISSA